MKDAFTRARPQARLQGSGSQLQKEVAMWFFISNNFEVKYETLILLDQIKRSRFSVEDLATFIAKVEGDMLKDFGPGESSTQGSEGSAYRESVVIGGNRPHSGGSSGSPGGQGASLEESYRSLNFSKLPSKASNDQLLATEGLSTDLTRSQFAALEFQQKKEWLLGKIMRLQISAGTQKELVDRLESTLRGEEQLLSENQSRMLFLEQQLSKAKQNNSKTRQDEHLLLAQLEQKEQQLLSAESEFKQAREKLVSSEREKKKLEENFMAEVLGFQTDLDQKLLQIQMLDRRNRELVEEKKGFEDMVEEYKLFSEDCKREARDLREAKDAEIGQLQKALDWEKQSQRRERAAEKQGFEVEKLALEQTIRELMYKNKVG